MVKRSSKGDEPMLGTKPPRNDPGKGRILEGDEYLKIQGYRYLKSKRALKWVARIITLGFIRLLENWFPTFRAKTDGSMDSLDTANFVLIRTGASNYKYREIFHEGPFVFKSVTGRKLINDVYRRFSYRKQNYFWVEERQAFETAGQIFEATTIDEYLQWGEGNGIDEKMEAEKRKTNGMNEIQISRKPTYEILGMEAITPFTCFQVFSVAVWLFDEYVYFACIIVGVTLYGIFTAYRQIRKMECKLRSMAAQHGEGVVEVWREGKETQIRRNQLVPGDIVLLPNHPVTLPCDLLLLNGSVILNEAMLTGESVPVTKTALTDIEDKGERLVAGRHDKYILFGGTAMLQARYYPGKRVKAIVLRTGFATSKGQLVRSIMYPKAPDFAFTKDLFLFVVFLLGVAVLGMIYTIIMMAMRHESVKRCIIRALDIVTIVVPPALPAAMTNCYVRSQKNLKESEIYCVQPSKIPICGAVNVACFDKTGTLTEEGLDFLLVRPVDYKPEAEKGEANFCPENTTVNATDLPLNGELAAAIATCHTLTRIEGQLLGDPIDLLLFQSTSWEFYEPTSPILSEKHVEEENLYDVVQPSVMRPPTGATGDLAIISQFPFSSELQRQSVLVHSPCSENGKKKVLYAKGSPEMIMSLSKPHTVPADYLKVVNQYSHAGYRLIAVARREVNVSFAKANRLKREDVENNLELLGLVVMENRVKEVTPKVIQELNDSNIRTVMVTGDNVLTALSVGRECGIIQPDRHAYLLEHHNKENDEKGKTVLTYKHVIACTDEDLAERIVVGEGGLMEIIHNGGHLSMTGSTFAVLQKEHAQLLPEVAKCCDVFARMAPEQKAALVTVFQEAGAKVLFTGDGANDCAALKAAHCGISLSDAEASIAAPFTSKVPDIRCVIKVICEGRACLVSSFSMVKFMAGYSLTQFLTIFILYHYGTNLTDFMFLYIDFVLITGSAFLFGNAPAAVRLHHQPPPTRLLTAVNCIAVIGQLGIMAMGQLLTNFLVIAQPWYIPYIVPGDEAEDSKASMVGTAVFLTSIIQYNALAVSYSAGAPHRQPLIRNPWLCVCLVVTSLISCGLAFINDDWLVNLMEFIHMPSIEFRMLCIIIGCCCGAFSLIFQKLIIDNWEKATIGDSGTAVSTPRDVETGKRSVEYKFV
ncbi:unnamed protein product, partial [Mesorhabditis spiculigera]